MRTLEESGAARRRKMERWAYYLMGVAIGLMLLGIFWSGRQRAAQRQQQAPISETQTDAPGQP